GQHSAAPAVHAADAAAPASRPPVPASAAAPALDHFAPVHADASACLLVPAPCAQTPTPLFQVILRAQIGPQQLLHVVLTPHDGAPQQRLQILDAVAPAKQQRAGLFQIDQLRLETLPGLAQEDVLRSEEHTSELQSREN